MEFESHFVMKINEGCCIVQIWNAYEVTFMFSKNIVFFFWQFKILIDNKKKEVQHKDPK